MRPYLTCKICNGSGYVLTTNKSRNIGDTKDCPSCLRKRRAQLLSRSYMVSEVQAREEGTVTFAENPNIAVGDFVSFGRPHASRFMRILAWLRLVPQSKVTFHTVIAQNHNTITTKERKEQEIEL